MVEGHVVDVGGTKCADSAARALNNRVQMRKRRAKQFFFQKKQAKSENNQIKINNQWGNKSGTGSK